MLSLQHCKNPLPQTTKPTPRGSAAGLMDSDHSWWELSSSCCWLDMGSKGICVFPHKMGTYKDTLVKTTGFSELQFISPSFSFLPPHSHSFTRSSPYLFFYTLLYSLPSLSLTTKNVLFKCILNFLAHHLQPAKVILQSPCRPETL